MLDEVQPALAASVEVGPGIRCAFDYLEATLATDPDVDYSGEATTLVEFRLETKNGGTLLTVTESGFDSIPEEYRSESFLRNESGWSAQMENIQKHVDG